MNTRKGDFVPLSSLRPKGRGVKEILAEIRTIYFRTTRQTIQNDLDHAVALLMSLPTEEDREKATVYMEGLADMRKEWYGSGKSKVKGSK